MTFRDLYRKLRESLLPICGEYAEHEAREIAEAVTKTAHDAFPLAMASNAELADADVDAAERILQRRMAHEPLEYIFGFAYFCGRRFAVTPDTLIPQSDTEVVCEMLMAHLPKGARLADIGTGSGAIAITALCERADITAVGYDISEAALDVARKNSEALGVANRFTPIAADVFSPDFLDGERFDLIVSNPPYIRSEIIPTLSPEVRHEPLLALDGGWDGLRFYRRLLDICPSHIKAGGRLIFEIGYDEGDAIGTLCRERGYGFSIFRDFGGNDRGVIIDL